MWQYIDTVRTFTWVHGGPIFKTYLISIFLDLSYINFFLSFIYFSKISWWQCFFYFTSLSSKRDFLPAILIWCVFLLVQNYLIYHLHTNPWYIFNFTFSKLEHIIFILMIQWELNQINCYRFYLCKTAFEQHKLSISIEVVRLKRNLILYGCKCHT